jgi:hypothetical protein
MSCKSSRAFAPNSSHTARSAADPDPLEAVRRWDPAPAAEVVAVEVPVEVVAVMAMAVMTMMAMAVMTMVAVMAVRAGPGTSGRQSNGSNGEHGSGRDDEITKHGVSPLFGVPSTPIR